MLAVNKGKCTENNGTEILIFVIFCDKISYTDTDKGYSRMWSCRRQASANRILSNSLPGTFAPKPFSSRALSIPGTFAPRSEVARELSFHGTFVLKSICSQGVMLNYTGEYGEYCDAWDA